MYIYKTTNIINNKIYIGLSTKSVEESITYYGSGLSLKSALKKYGKESFIKEILEDNINSIDILNEREMYWIAKFNSTDRNIGYNMVDGGSGTKGHKIQHTEEAKAKMSKNHKGYKLSEAHKQKLSALGSGRKHTEETKDKLRGPRAKRGPMSEEAKLKLSLLLKGKLKGPMSEETKLKLSLIFKEKHKSKTS